MEPVHATPTPTPQEAMLATQSASAMSRWLDHLPETVTFMSPQFPEASVTVPSSVIRLWIATVQLLSQGSAVLVTALEDELTTREAADLLNVSRPFVIKLLDTQTIPHRKVGSHRRVRIADLLAYRATMQREQRDALSELTALGQELQGDE